MVNAFNNYSELHVQGALSIWNKINYEIGNVKTS